MLEPRPLSCLSASAASAPQLPQPSAAGDDFEGAVPGLAALAVLQTVHHLDVCVLAYDVLGDDDQGAHAGTDVDLRKLLPRPVGLLDLDPSRNTVRVLLGVVDLNLVTIVVVAGEASRAEDDAGVRLRGRCADNDGARRRCKGGDGRDDSSLGQEVPPGSSEMNGVRSGPPVHG